MAAINWKRVHLGTVAGGVVWSIWSMTVNALILGPRYMIGQKMGVLLTTPRFTIGGFLGMWFLMLFVLSSLLSCLYALLRGPLGPGPKTALQIGFLAGFAVALPMNWSVVNWTYVGRFIPFWWMLDLWVGSVLAALVAGWFYKD